MTEPLTSEQRAPHLIECNYQRGPIGGAGCICEVVNKNEFARLQRSLVERPVTSRILADNGRLQMEVEELRAALLEAISYVELDSETPYELTQWRIAAGLPADETSKSPWCGVVHNYGPGFTCRKLRDHVGPHGCYDATGQLCEWTEPAQMANPDPADTIPPLV